MRGVSIAAAAVCFLVCVSGIGFSGTIDSPELSSDRPALVHGLRESTVTRIAPVQQTYGVGYTRATTNWECELFDAPATAVIGAIIGSSYGAWVVWDLSSMPFSAQVLRVEVEHDLWPDSWNEPGLRVVYKRTGSVYLPPPECWDVWQCMTYCPVYASVDMGAEPGLRRVDLGVGAMGEVQRQIWAGGQFCVAITVNYLDMIMGTAALPGWNSGSPELLVTWWNPSPVARASWASIKALYSP
jgi:hypothetical protein